MQSQTQIAFVPVLGIRTVVLCSSFLFLNSKNRDGFKRDWTSLWKRHPLKIAKYVETTSSSESPHVDNSWCLGKY